MGSPMHLYENTLARMTRKRATTLLGLPHGYPSPEELRASWGKAARTVETHAAKDFLLRLAAQDDDGLGDLDDISEGTEDNQSAEVVFQKFLVSAGLGGVTWYLYSTEDRDWMALLGKKGPALVMTSLRWSTDVVSKVVTKTPSRGGVWTEQTIKAVIKEAYSGQKAPTKWSVVPGKLTVDWFRKNRRTGGGSKLGEALVGSGLISAADPTKAPTVELLFRNNRHGTFWAELEGADKVGRSQYSRSFSPHLDVFVRVYGKEYKLSQKTLGSVPMNKLERVISRTSRSYYTDGSVINLTRIRVTAPMVILNFLLEALTDEPSALVIALSQAQEFYEYGPPKETLKSRLASWVTAPVAARILGCSLEEVLS